MAEHSAALLGLLILQGQYIKDKQQQKNWWIDIDGLTQDSWEALSRGYQCKWNIKQFKVTDLSYFALMPDFQTINTSQFYTEQKKQKQKNEHQQQQIT